MKNPSIIMISLLLLVGLSGCDNDEATALDSPPPSQANSVVAPKAAASVQPRPIATDVDEQLLDLELVKNFGMMDSPLIGIEAEAEADNDMAGMPYTEADDMEANGEE
jgi:hypothetical protein